MSKNYEKEFRSFLEEKELTKKFFQYLKSSGFDEEKYFPKDFDPIIGGYHQNFVAMAFDWHCTEEGYEFWRDIHIEWFHKYAELIGKPISKIYLS
jgi:hypothetical protein